MYTDALSIYNPASMPKNASQSQETSKNSRPVRHVLRFPVVAQTVSALTSARFVVRGNSMAPRLVDGDYLLVNRLAYVTTCPERGDIVVIRSPFESDKDYVKRIVALPQEHVQIDGVSVIIDGQTLGEPYCELAPESHSVARNQWILEDGQYFVMGDNRNDSMDSRYFWPVDKQLIVGRAWFRYWPLSRLGPVKSQRPFLKAFER